MKVKGDYHTHSNFSDGKASVIDMVRGARGKGIKEVAVTDHSFGHMRGVKLKHFDRLHSDVEAAHAEMQHDDGPSVLFGLETNVVSVDGTIDLKPEQREYLDIVLFGIHVMVRYKFRTFWKFLVPNLFWSVMHWVPRGRILKNTEVVTRVLERNDIDIWVHPGRYFKVDAVELAKVCASRGVLVELNNRKNSLRPIDFEKMVAAGAKFIIGSDAHIPSNISNTNKIEEFLKNCDYSEDAIINLKQTYTEFKKPKIVKNEKEKNDNLGDDKERVTEEGSKRKRRWFK